MSWDENDVYYNPEKFDLTVIGELHDPWANYSFDDLVVWEHKDGDLYWANDGGCSCPSPFEWATSLEKINHVPKGNQFSDEVIALIDAIKAHCPKEYWQDEDEEIEDPQAAKKTQLIAKVLGKIKE